MIKHDFRVAIWVVMTVVVIVVGGGGTGVSAADCEIPPFLETGRAYSFTSGVGEVFVTVVEIDRQTCWVKGNWKYGGTMGIEERRGTSWFNLKQVYSIMEEQAPPAQPQPGRRR
jgi:hypothetical protein